MRASIMTVAPDYSFDRMMKDYLRLFYLPAGALGTRVYGNNCAGARELAEWERRVQGGWPQVSISASGPERGEMTMGQPLVVRASLRPGALAPDDIAVELVCVREGDGLEAVAIPMKQTGRDDGGYRLRGSVRPARKRALRLRRPRPARNIRTCRTRSPRTW